MVGSQQLLLTVNEISRDTHHNAEFICEVEIILPSGNNITDRMNFVINTDEYGKHHRDDKITLFTNTTMFSCRIKFCIEYLYYK